MSSYCFIHYDLKQVNNTSQEADPFLQEHA